MCRIIWSVILTVLLCHCALGKTPKSLKHRICSDATGICTPPPVLYSIPGSGNTGTRILIDYVMGRHSGSMYDDYAIKKAGLEGEMECNTNQTVIKAHPVYQTFNHLFTGPMPTGLKCYKSGIMSFHNAIVITRDPSHAIFAEYTRQLTHSHTARLSKADFDAENFAKFAKCFAQTIWVIHNNDYAALKAFTNSIFIRFEDIFSSDQTTKHAALRTMTEYLTDDVITEAELEDAYAHGEAMHRKSPSGGQSDVVEYDFAVTPELRAEIDAIVNKPWEILLPNDDYQHQIQKETCGYANLARKKQQPSVEKEDVIKSNPIKSNITRPRPSLGGTRRLT